LMARLFTAAEDKIDHPAHIVVLSYRLWQHRFGGDKNILNSTAGSGDPHGLHQHWVCSNPHGSPRGARS
jgi:hypothetical protein